ncbi:MAG: CoA transferase [Gammaproteobacteria bacterium]|jgi:crotonobetainyl-CoA:carnitine CoA-transferase CaiB-like acyl-CoA transferase|nr:CoA transferase [Gammaproteobacteria bacterium]MBT4492743.1 CoA transferase [Gammaproteobacteria bacterium]MBT7369061.1 CoA transferase [Gammaproteobacteria bacterium]
MSDEVLLFEGLKVLDVGSWIAGPVAATMLADRGAEVLKIEVPEDGDGYRNWAMLPFTPTADTNYAWAMDARNKRSLALNLKSDEGMEILHRLIRECDIYITNQPLPLRRELKLSYDDISSLNERMIYASLTPYGEEGPDRDNEAFDLVAYWNRSGMMDHLRHPGVEPIQALPGMGDHPTAVAMYAAIVTALMQRERTGKGTKVHTSLLANGVWSASCMVQAQLAQADFSTVPPQILTSALYETSDDRLIQLNMIRTDEGFDRLLVAMDAFELLADERFSTLESRLLHAEELTQKLRDIFRAKTLDEWIAILRDEHEVPIEPVARFSDLPTDDHLTLNKMITPPVDDVGIDFIVNDPVNVNGLARVGATRAPEIGEHTDEVLAELGFDKSTIKSMHDKGIVGCHQP